MPRQRPHERGRVGNMLDYLHAGDEVELAFEPLELAGAIVDLQALARGMFACDRDERGRGIKPGYGRAKPRQGLRQQPGAAADVERGAPVKRPPRAFVALPMLVDLVADVFEAHRVKLV